MSRRVGRGLAAGWLTLFVVMFSARALQACTAFLLSSGSHVVLGKSYDWDWEAEGMLVVNGRGVDKVALTQDTRDNRARWVSKYGSITFNQFGRELPNGGMNDAGLVVADLWRDGTIYPEVDQ